MPVEVKPGVSIRGLRPETLFAIERVNEVFRDMGYPVTTITSGTDGSHSNGSLHYAGCAVDFRIRHIEVEKLEPIRAEISRRLGAEFDVVLEGGAQPHYHVEFQPKKQVEG